MTMAAGEGQSPILEYQIRSNDIDFSGWSKLIPMLREYELKGQGSFSAQASGPTERLQYQAQVDAKDLSAKAPKLKAIPVMQFSMKVVTDQVEELVFSMKAPGNDLRVKGKVISFTTPRAEFTVSSSGLDFDQLFVLPPLKSKENVAAESATSSAAKGTVAPKAPVADYDSMLEPLRSNEMASKVTATMDFNLASLKFYDVKMTSIQGRMRFQNLIAALEKASLGVWDGTVRSDFAFDLKPKAPHYRYSLQVADLSLQKAVDSQFALLKNTVLGSANFSMQGTGVSFNQDAAMKNLEAKGSWSVKEATFATMDIGKVAVEAINGAIGKVASKIPGVKDRLLSAPSSRETRYESIGASFTISKGDFKMPDFVAKAKSNGGIDVKGTTEVALSDGYPLKAKWEFIDTYNFTHARDLSIDQAGVKVDNLFAEGNNPVRFPVTVGCKAVDPCFSYTEVPEYLAGVALSKMTKAAGKKVEAAVTKKAEEVVEGIVGKKASPQVKKALKGLKGLLK
jgi:hypothetical protein